MFGGLQDETIIILQDRCQDRPQDKTIVILQDKTP